MRCTDAPDRRHDTELIDKLRRVLEAHPYDPTKAMAGPSRAEVLAIIDR